MDANSRFPTGILSGTISSFGDYDQCLDIKGLVNDTIIRGKYCLLTIRPPRPQDDINYRFKFANDSKYKKSWYENEINDLIILDNFAPLVNGICVPSVCDRHEIKQILNESVLRNILIL